ncbi:MAG TPA: pyridoxal-phosphate dependent enzyme [Sandaracinaceae bacterium LLY-WYZ-13_1]|nr:pyridoxal-phosphate dependent enzyme [Sandaracinaceae bacterium LLY-WYZ-13_1]
MALAELPTAVERVDGLCERTRAEIWIKRDDATGRRYGGNKVRKLEYVLGEALAGGHDSLITSGAAGSHHALATAIHGAEQGLKVHAVLMPQRYSAHAQEHLQALLVAGAQVHPVRSGALVVPRTLALATRQRLRGRSPLVVPPGGSSTSGVVGHVEAGLELARQMEAGVLPEVDAVFVALGTGGTAAGLAVGLAAAGVTATVVGVRVVPRSIGNATVLRSHVSRVVHRLRRLDDRFPDVAAVARRLLEIDHAEVGDGYGVPTSAGRNAARLAREHAGLTLEPTYTAKAFAAMLRWAGGVLQGKRVLYVHTLSGVDLGPSVHRAPPLPATLRRLLKRA